jgi:predicted DNA-binding transcriptional regulator YafY
MPRTLEVVRQLRLIQELDRSHGLTIEELAAVGECTTRTIRRDLKALESAGFPLYDDREEGQPVRWRLLTNPLAGIGTSFRLTELCALYFSRALLESATRPPFDTEVASALARIEAGLPERMRRFLDAIPGVLAAKPARRKLARHQDPKGARTSRLMEAALDQREVSIRYASVSSAATKDYVVHPYRLVYADGGIYLLAFVPAYGEVRTFAMERIEQAALLDTKFRRQHPLPAGAFPDSLGVHTGRPIRIELEFAPRAAAYVRERQWHPSQALTPRADGGLSMTLSVCRDEALRTWLLGFGPDVKVISPASVAEEIAAAHRAAHARYSGIEPAPAAAAPIGPVQRTLPFPAQIEKARAAG